MMQRGDSTNEKQKYACQILQLHGKAVVILRDLTRTLDLDLHDPRYYHRLVAYLAREERGDHEVGDGED